jgi:glycosyltransferase involved in cell wall biosynthesis
LYEGTIYGEGACLQVKTGRKPVSVVQVNYAFDKGLTDPDQLLDRYFTLTGWSDALVGAGAGAVAVVQRFHQDVQIARRGVMYIFRRAAIPSAAAALRPDVAHVNGLEFPARTWRLRRTLEPSCAVVVQSHADGGAIGRDPRLRLLGQAARHAVDAFLFAADEHAASWRDAGFIAPDQPTYRVMPASSTIGPIARSAAVEASGVSGSPAVLWVGRLNANKDPLTAIDGFERALTTLADATLTMIYGDDDLLPDVRARIQRSTRLAERVRLIGAVPHERMAAFYSAADLFLAGSHHEGSGYSLMEALACGTLPVVTDIPTFRLLTGNGAAGRLWRCGYAADCARALVEVAARDRDAERAALARHFAQHLSWDAVGRRALTIYEEVLTSKLNRK